MSAEVSPLEWIGYTPVIDDSRLKQWKCDFYCGYEQHIMTFRFNGYEWLVECCLSQYVLSNPNDFIPQGFNPSQDKFVCNGTWYMRNVLEMEEKELEAVYKTLANLNKVVMRNENNVPQTSNT